MYRPLHRPPNRPLEIPFLHPKVLSLCAILAIAIGCASPDPEGRFNDYIDAVEHASEAETGPDPTDANGPDTDVTPGTDVEGDGSDVCVPDALDPEGVYFLAFSAPLDREKPIYIELTIAANGGAYDFTFQPLNADVLIDDNGNPFPNPNARTPIGASIVASGVDIDATSGDFIAIAENIRVEGEANPLTGRDIAGDIELNGSFNSNGGGCGAGAGQIREPLSLSLASSTFVFTRQSGSYLDIDPVAYTCANAPPARRCGF